MLLEKPKTMIKITIEREKCIGCGSCEAVCPQYWKISQDGKADFLGPQELKEIGCNQEAADSCPVQCIIIKE